MENLGYVKIDPDDIELILKELNEGVKKYKNIQEIRAIQELEKSVNKYKNKKRFKFNQKKVDKKTDEEIVKDISKIVQLDYYRFPYGDVYLMNRYYLETKMEEINKFKKLIKNLKKESYVDIVLYNIANNVSLTSSKEYENFSKDQKENLLYWEFLYNNNYIKPFSIEEIKISL